MPLAAELLGFRASFVMLILGAAGAWCIHGTHNMHNFQNWFCCLDVLCRDIGFQGQVPGQVNGKFQVLASQCGRLWGARWLQSACFHRGIGVDPKACRFCVHNHESVESHVYRAIHEC